MIKLKPIARQILENDSSSPITDTKNKNKTKPFASTDMKDKRDFTSVHGVRWNQTCVLVGTTAPFSQLGSHSALSDSVSDSKSLRSFPAHLTSSLHHVEGSGFKIPSASCTIYSSLPC